MHTNGNNDRVLIIEPGYKKGRHGFTVCKPGRKIFLEDEVFSALAFGDEALTDIISFHHLTEIFTSQLEALAKTPSWDKDKKQRHIQQLNQLFARGCASWFKIGQESVK